MITAFSNRRFVIVAALLTATLWATPALAQDTNTPDPQLPLPRCGTWGQSNNNQSVSQGFNFNNPANPSSASPDVRPPGVQPSQVATSGLVEYDPSEEGRPGVYKLEGEGKEGTIKIKVNNLYAGKFKYVWLQYDAWTINNATVTPSVKSPGGSSANKPPAKVAVNNRPVTFPLT